MTNSAFPLPNPGGGTVTSVAMTVSPAAAGSVSGSPITSTGTFALLLTGNFIRVLNIPLGTAASYAPSLGTRLIFVEMVGSGGSGGSINDALNQSAAGGGGAGGFCCKIISPVVASYTYTVGAAPAPASPGNNPGNPGNASTFTDGAAVNMSAGGGLGGGGSGNFNVVYGWSAPGGLGGVSSGGDLNFTGGAGLPGIVSNVAGAGSGAGGASFFGGGGGSKIQGAVGQQTGAGASSGSGSGGSGGCANGLNTNDSGGTGGSGLIRIWEYT